MIVESIDCPHGDHVERIAAATATTPASTAINTRPRLGGQSLDPRPSSAGSSAPGRTYESAGQLGAGDEPEPLDPPEAARARAG